jgi:hypothetical protein
VIGYKKDKREPISLLVAPSHWLLLAEITWVPCESRHPSVASYFTVELTVLKEMAQALAELFGLSLPGNSPDKT